MKRLSLYIVIILAGVMMASCGSSRKAAEAGKTGLAGSASPSVQPTPTAKALLRSIQDNAVYQKNIVSDVDFTLSAGGRQMTVGGKLRMRKDDVIRIQLVAFGLMEVGRLEFTKEYVMIVDKYHKLYAKEDYSQVSFLKENGLDFYALQALFWNQLYMPGSQKVTESALKEFDVKPIDGKAQSDITLNRGDFRYKWLANNTAAVLENVNVNYTSRSSGSTNVDCKYSNFVPMGSKKFPSDIQLTLQTTAIKPAKTLTLGLALSGISDSDKWEARTELSKKYKQVSIDEMMNALMSLSK